MTILVGGLQTILEAMPDAETGYNWLRRNVTAKTRLATC
jgi:hypothetical protein